MPARARARRIYTPDPNALILAVYSDGACQRPERPGDLGAGGWGVHVVFRDGRVHEFGGFDEQTTVNRMELTAAIEAAQFVRQFEPSSTAQAFSDSRYVIDGINDWHYGWVKRGWVNSTGQPVKNQDLWQELIQAKGDLFWNWCRGHSGIPGNERADIIASSYYLRQKPPIGVKVLDLSSLKAGVVA